MLVSPLEFSNQFLNYGIKATKSILSFSIVLLLFVLKPENGDL